MDMPTKFQVVATSGTVLTALGIDAMAHMGPVGMIVGMTGAYALYKYGPRDVDMNAVLGTLKGQWHLRPSVLPKGNLVRARQQPNATPEREEDTYVSEDVGNVEDDELRHPEPLSAGLFTFSKVLADFTPTLEHIYLGQSEDGTPVFCRAKDLCHVALAGSTGNGKSSIIRMLMSQLCAAGANVLLLNPHFTRWDREADPPEDWTPFEPYLIHAPMECRHYDTIHYYLKQVATELLPKRLDKYAHSQRLGRPYFLVLDELPAIMENVPDAAKYLKAILQQGRKVGIYLISASQDFLVKTIDPSGKSGGAVRDCYRTAFYTGGDGTTGSVLLDMPAKFIPEDQLGKGVIMLRNGALIKKARVVMVPYVDNCALYSLLGPSTYVPDDEDDDDVLHLAGEKQTDGLDPNASFAELYQAMTGNSVKDTDSRMPALPASVPVTPLLQEKGRMADDVPMEQAIKLWNVNGGKMSINELAEVWGLKRNQAEKLQKKIIDMAMGNE